MNLCLIIPVFNRKLVTLHCLTQIFAQKSTGIEVIVVDDGSTDGTSAIIQKLFPQVHLVAGTGDWWYTRCINEGLRYADKNLQATHYLLLNDDVVFSDKYMETVCQILETEKEGNGIYGSVSFDSADKGKPTYLGVKKLVHWRNKQYHYSIADYDQAVAAGRQSWQSPFLPGRGMFFSRAVFQQNGLLDESFAQYGSDYEYSARGKAKGIKTEVVLSAVLYSYENLTGAGSPKSKPTIKKFIKSLFNKYSPTYPLNDSRLIWMYGDKILLPISFLFILAGKCKAYLKYR